MRPPLRWERIHPNTIVVDTDSGHHHLEIGAHRLLIRESRADLMQMATAHKDQKRRLKEAQDLLNKLQSRFACPGCGAMMWREEEGSAWGADDETHDNHVVTYECSRLVTNNIVKRSCNEWGDDPR